MAPRSSVVIPTHEPSRLREAVESALRQTDPDLEVVVVPNGGAEISREIPSDPRIRVVPLEGKVCGVGAVKSFAFAAARGEILVELDHDDILAPDAVRRVREAMRPGVGFVYSNFAEFRDGTWEPNVYSAEHGWVSRDAQIGGRPLTEMVAFDPSAESVGFVYYAPNHVRAWSREAYDVAGGHDPSLPVCDDHDLLIRTYLTTRMACLYLYRVRDGQTSLARNAEIQARTWALYEANVERLVLRWCELHGLPAYDLGGAHNPRAGWTSVDAQGAEVSADLSKRWPWDDSTVGAFRAFDFLEHLPDKMHTLSEIHRCLVPGGWILSCTPSALGQGAFQDPTHRSLWVKNSFKYVTDRSFAKYIGNGTVRFKEMRLVESFPSEWHRQENVPYVTFDGVCLKDGHRGPGAIRI